MSEFQPFTLTKVTSVQERPEKYQPSVSKHAWKEHLEKQILKAQVELNEHGNDRPKTADSRTQSERSSSILESGQLNSANFSAADLKQIKSFLPNVEAKNVGVIGNVSSAKKDLVLNAMSMNNGYANIKDNSVTLKLERYATSSSNKKTVIQTAAVKTFDIKLLADGELVLRAYQQGVLNREQLDKLINQLQQITEKNIQKVKFNGELVWEASSTASLNYENYMIDLIY